MPLNQPIRTIIHSSDFRDKAYCFAVESVLTSQERIGVLSVSASAGYLLATSSTNEFKREQVIDHIRQEDDKWVAKATITLLIAEDRPVDGRVIIRNSAAETLAITIDLASTTELASQQQPALIVSESELSFSQTSSDRPSFTVLTVAQQHSEEPVTLSTDAPEFFQLASDSRPAFLPTLTLVPSHAGTYVHIRYSASKSGFHSSQLTIQSSFERRTVVLNGRSSGSIPVIRTNPLISRQVKALQIPKQPSISKRWVGALSLFIMSSLVYAGYSNRCQLFPTLCQTPEVHRPNPQVVQITPSLAHNNTTSAEAMVRLIVPKLIKRKEVSPPVAKLSSPSSASSVTILEKQVIADAVDQERRVETETPELPSQQQSKRQGIRKPNNRQTTERITAPASTDESELERTLNQKPGPL